MLHACVLGPADARPHRPPIATGRGTARRKWTCPPRPWTSSPRTACAPLPPRQVCARPTCTGTSPPPPRREERLCCPLHGTAARRGAARSVAVYSASPRGSLKPLCSRALHHTTPHHTTPHHTTGLQVDSKYPELHILVNNAGISFLKRSFTPDNVGALAQTNFLGPYTLTRLLEKKVRGEQGERARDWPLAVCGALALRAAGGGAVPSLARRARHAPVAAPGQPLPPGHRDAPGILRAVDASALCLARGERGRVASS